MNMQSASLRRIRSMIVNNLYIAPNDKVLVAVSGGADSVFLLHVLAQLSIRFDWQLYVGHVNHNLRAEESDEDERFVKQLADHLRLPFFTAGVDVTAAMERSGRSLQDAARQLRYQALENMARPHEIHLVAVAHHANDQVETVLHRFLRGSSLQGLGGISPDRSWPYSLSDSYSLRIIRPLLQTTRQEITDYLSEHHIPFRNDPSNTSMKYFRNKLRLQLIPLLTDEYNPNLIETIGHTAELLRDENDYLEQQSRREFIKITTRLKAKVLLDRHKLSALPVALQRRVIKLILYYLVDDSHQWQFTHIENVRDLVLHSGPQAVYHLPRNVFVRREYEVIHISVSTDFIGSGDLHLPVADPIPVPVPGSIEIPALGIRVRTDVHKISRETKQEPLPSSHWTVWFDYDEMEEQKLYIRSKLPGDRMQVIGMQGSKKVKDLLMEARISKQQRDNWPVLMHGEQLIWTIGLRRSSAFQVTDSSSTLLRMEAEPINLSKSYDLDQEE
ncbi:MAG: hypothetical protein JWN30_2039 [Bacilli bacterium]|nr:hypothetical protein [Bacilli bacterium]